MNGIIRTFVRHPVAPNLAMIIMILAGLWAGAQLTRQLLPNFALSVVTVSVAWPGASAEDVETSITAPLEEQLLGLGEARRINSTSSNGLASISLEFPDGTEMGPVLDKVKERVALVADLPDTAETPRVSLLARNEPVTRLVVSGPDLRSLRVLVARFERELRSLGVSRTEVSGLPNEEIAIEVPGQRLSELNLSLGDLASRVRDASVDTPAGSVGRGDVARQLRTLSKQRSVEGFESVPVAADETGRRLALGDIAQITRRAKPGEVTVFAGGEPAVEIRILRAESDDALSVAGLVYDWVGRTRDQLPDGVAMMLYDEPWRLVDERIDLMLSNGLAGLLLVGIILFVFLNGRVAFWVAVGIPVSVLAALMALYLLGGSINMISMFALVMTMGIIVDDAIVVAEEAVSLYQGGAGPVSAAEQGAQRMFAPVTAASLTTVAAFIPLLTIGGPSGQILFAIPLIVICVVVASLIECFIVLPGHLRHSLEATARRQPGRLRRRLDVAIYRFREQRVRRWLEAAVAQRGVTVGIAIAAMIVSFGLLFGGRIGFSFFPQPDSPTLFASARFVAGSPPERVEAFLDQAVAALAAVEREAGEQQSVLVVRKLGVDFLGTESPHLGHLVAELLPGDQRTLSNAELIRAWRAKVPRPPGLESFLITGGGAGPPGSDIEVEFSGADAETLKQASLELQRELEAYPGVSGIRDDTAYGREQLIIELRPAGLALGMTDQSLNRQLRAAFEGEVVQRFQDAGDEVEVRVLLSESERASLAGLDTLPVVLPNGETTPLANIARIDYRRGFDSLRHSDGLLAVTVTANVDGKVNNANAVRGRLGRTVLPGIADSLGVEYRFRGGAENQRESLGDLALALPMALFLIYIILAWVFESYSWPVAVLVVIPFGLVGAMVGHWLLGFDLTMFSLFGFFGLSGIVINDSIILVSVYKELREAGEKPLQAAIDAGVRRFRPVMLTSVTTIAGIMPLLFETALQAQFLKPMVITLGFGLIVGTLMVLFLLPATLVGIEGLAARLAAVRSRFPAWIVGIVPASLINAGGQRPRPAADPLPEPGRERGAGR